jgi:tubby-related protein 1
VSLFDSERSAPDDVPTVSHELESARPAWNASCRAYVLNFNGRVTRPSVKNFQLVCAAAQDDADVSGDDASHPRVFAQFGRVDDNLFTLDFAHPLGPLTAFAACLSAFESKFARE